MIKGWLILLLVLLTILAIGCLGWLADVLGWRWAGARLESLFLEYRNESGL